MKRSVIIIAFVILVFVLALFLYLVFFRPPVPSPIVEPPVVDLPPRLPVSREAWERMTIDEREAMGLPLYDFDEILPPPPPVVEPPPVVPEISDVAEGGLTWFNPVSSVGISKAVASFDGQNSIYYHEQTGEFYQITPDGEKTLLTDRRYPYADKITWAPTKDRAILEFPDGFKIFYDFKEDKQITLPFDWYEFSFNPSGREIAFKTESPYPEDRWLAIGNPDGTGGKAIEHMGENADKVIVSYSPNNQIIAFSATGDPRGAFEQEILLIGKHGEGFPSLLVDGRGFEPQWSPQGNKILYSVYSDRTNYNPTLYVVDGHGDQMARNRIDLGLHTWAHKCTIDYAGNNAYCAVPRDLPYGSGLVPELAKYNRDDFYKIDLRTGRASFLAESAFGSYNVSQIFLSADESLLYFIDKDLERLHYIRIR